MGAASSTSALARGWEVKQATIENGKAISDPVFFGEFARGMLRVRTAWTAADIAFECSHDNVDFHDLVDDSGALVVLDGVAANTWIPLPTELQGAAYFRLRSADSSTPANDVNQGAERTVDLVLKA